MPAPSYFPSRTLLCLLTFAAPFTGVAQTYTPVSVTGFNRDIVAENDETRFADSFDTVDQWGGDPWSFHEAGVLGAASGLPANRTIVSENNANITFQLADYDNLNVLFLSNNDAFGSASGTLTLPTPTRFSHLAILSTSANGGGLGGMVLHFSNGSSSNTLNYQASDWYDAGAGNRAYQAQGRYTLDPGRPEGEIEESENGEAPYLYETALALGDSGLGYEDLFIASITFTAPSGGENLSTAIFAISGANATAVPEPSTYALLVGALACLIVVLKRNKRPLTAAGE